MQVFVPRNGNVVRLRLVNSRVDDVKGPTDERRLKLGNAVDGAKAQTTSNLLAVTHSCTSEM